MKIRSFASGFQVKNNSKVNNASYPNLSPLKKDTVLFGCSCRWINDLLKSVEKNPSDEAIKMLENCGKSCAERLGFLEQVKVLKELAKDCRTRRDYVKFLNDHLPLETRCVEVEDGIEMHLGKGKCGCPMYPQVQSPALCNCTNGSNKATWSEFFSKPIESEVIESHLRGGKDCVIKLYV